MVDVRSRSVGRYYNVNIYNNVAACVRAEEQVEEKAKETYTVIC